MPRVRREKCPNSIYHLIVRGNNRENIFRDYMDREVYLNRVKHYKEKFQMEIYAYCMMTNHVHLVVYDNGQDISKFMQGLNLSYAIYFNKKYDRCGHVFQGRFTSAMIKTDDYFIHVSKYVHLNPVKANIVADAIEYNWSSFKYYMENQDRWGIVNTERILKYFSDDFGEARKLYLEYIHNGEDMDEAEVAIALETLHEKQEIQGTKKESSISVSIKKVFEVIERELEIHRLDLMRRNNRSQGSKRDICIYLMALTTRLSYKELADIFWVKPAAIGSSIKRMVEKMVFDNEILHRVDRMRDLIMN
nr:transposase [uncultured Cellulosilyticum sp.]